jgi:hypothetical protein
LERCTKSRVHCITALTAFEHVQDRCCLRRSEEFDICCERLRRGTGCRISKLLREIENSTCMVRFADKGNKYSNNISIRCRSSVMAVSTSQVGVITISMQCDARSGPLRFAYPFISCTSNQVLQYILIQWHCSVPRNFWRRRRPLSQSRCVGRAARNILSEWAVQAPASNPTTLRSWLACVCTAPHGAVVESSTLQLLRTKEQRSSIDLWESSYSNNRRWSLHLVAIDTFELQEIQTLADVGSTPRVQALSGPALAQSYWLLLL